MWYYLIVNKMLFSGLFYLTCAHPFFYYSIKDLINNFSLVDLIRYDDLLGYFMMFPDEEVVIMNQVPLQVPQVPHVHFVKYPTRTMAR